MAKKMYSTIDLSYRDNFSPNNTQFQEFAGALVWSVLVVFSTFTRNYQETTCRLFILGHNMKEPSL